MTKQIKTALDDAVKVIVDSQVEGGFPYNPGGATHEGSITVCGVEALRAARDAGIKVSKKSIDDAVEYMEKTYGSGSFAYRLGSRPSGSYALSAAGVCVLIASGNDSKEVKLMISECLTYMKNFRPGSGYNNHNRFYFYSHFYAAQAFHFKGGKDWRIWYNGMKSELLESKIESDNYVKWSSPSGEAGGSEYFSTALAVLILQMPNEYLPLFQR